MQIQFLEGQIQQIDSEIEHELALSRQTRLDFDSAMAKTNEECANFEKKIEKLVYM